MTAPDHVNPPPTLGYEAPAHGGSKVPQVTLVFWIIKIAATTLGETGGDAVSMSMKLGYAVGTLIFAAIFAAAVTAQIVSKRYRPWLYWTTIVATTTVGTTLADLSTRDIGIGYAGGSALLLGLLLLSLVVWHRVTGSVSFKHFTTPRAEVFYWVTIMFSQTLGTALGDWTADDEGGLGLGYGWSAVIFGSMLAIVALLYLLTKVNRVALFWAAFILTRPLGAVVGDYLDKPVAKGGLELSRYTASAGLLAAMVVCVLLFERKTVRTGDAG